MSIEAPPIAERLIRIGELSKLSGLPVSTLRRLADERRIPAYRIGDGTHRLFPLTSALESVRTVLMNTPNRL